MAKLMLVAMLVGVSGGAAAQTPEESPFRITVRSHKLSIPLEEFSAARQAAGRILGEAGVAVTWLHCSSSEAPGRVPADCQQPLGPNDVILMVQAAPPGSPKNAPDPDARPVALGVSYVDLQAGGGSVASVYTDRVSDLARGTGVERFDLLARAIAHEIGHLLMGTNRHTSRGLMRAVWFRTDVRRNRAADWRFSAAESRAMRTALSARSAERYAGRRQKGETDGTPPLLSCCGPQ